MERTGKCYGQTDGQTDEQMKAIPLIPVPLHGRGLKMSMFSYLLIVSCGIFETITPQIDAYTRNLLQAK